MTTTKIRQKVMEYINNADERILNAVYAMLKEYEGMPAGKSVLSEKQYEIIEGRWKNHKSGKSKSYTIEQAKRHLEKR